MASADSPRLRSYALGRSATNGYVHWKVVAIATCLALLAIARAPQLATQIATMLVVGAICTAWQFHLESSSLRWFWSIPLSALLAAQLLLALLRTPVNNASMEAAALASGCIIYLMLWALAGQNSRHSLQSLASMALLLALALFARPIALIAALFLSLVFVISCRRRFNGYLEPSLLIFTPSALCFVVTLLLNSLGISAIRSPISRFHLHLGIPWHRPAFVGGPLGLLLHLYPVLAVAFAAVICRMLEARTDIPDLAYSALLLGLLAGIYSGFATDPSALLNITMIAYGGGMCLLAATPLNRFVSRLFVLLVCFAALVMELR